MILVIRHEKKKRSSKISDNLKMEKVDPILEDRLRQAK